MNASTSSCDPEVSVVMPCYNDARYLPDAIESVLNQSFVGFELIVVDDGSTDGTAEIMSRFCGNDGRINLITKKHTGLTESLNVAVSAARGRWIARIDSDDLCDPQRLAKQVSAIRNGNHVLVGSGFVEIDEHGEIVSEHRYPARHEQLVRRLATSRGVFPHSSVLFRRDKALEVGAYNPRFIKSQDRDLWLRLSELGTIACIDECLVSVRKHDGRLSSSTSDTDSQFVFGTLAAACFEMRSMHASDPSCSASEDEWREFVNWSTRNNAVRTGEERRQVWAVARTSYFAAGSRIVGMLRFAVALIQSGHFTTLIREKMFGLSLPKSLATEWLKRKCAEL